MISCLGVSHHFAFNKKNSITFFLFPLHFFFCFAHVCLHVLFSQFMDVIPIHPECLFSAAALRGVALTRGRAAAVAARGAYNAAALAATAAFRHTTPLATAATALPLAYVYILSLFTFSVIRFAQYLLLYSSCACQEMRLI